MTSLFNKIFKGKIIIVGVGNPLKGDDGFGPALIEKLNGKVKAVCIDAGNAPENYAGKIIKETPDTILIVDAIHLGRKPGEYELLSKSDIAETGLSTHNMSLNMFIEFLEKETSADIYILGVQPEKVNFNEEMSENVKKAIDELSRLIFLQFKMDKQTAI